MGNKDLLKTLARVDAVEALEVGDADQTSGRVPDWCEIVLDIHDAQGIKRLNLTRHDAELVIEVLHIVLHPNSHKSSPVQRLWAELDDLMDFMMEEDEPEVEDRVRAKALAEAIAMIAHPHADPPDVDAVRDEAVERWENRQ